VPEEDESVSPLGSDLDVMVQEYGLIPPVDVRVAE
jgi:hypothetical protein